MSTNIIITNILTFFNMSNAEESISHVIRMILRGALPGSVMTSSKPTTVLFTIHIPILPILLEKVTLSEQLASIGAPAFFVCQSLSELYIPDSVMEIGHRCFYQNQLKKLTLPGRFSNWLVEMRVDDDTKLEFYGELPPAPEDPFEFLISPQEEEVDTPIPIVAKKVIISDGVTHIDESAFEQRRQLKQVYLSEGLTVIGPTAFEFCCELLDISIPSSVLQIGHAAFRACAISSLTINAKITQIDASTFAFQLNYSAG